MKSKIIKLLFIAIIIFVFAPSGTKAYTSPQTFGFQWVGGPSADTDVMIGVNQLSLEIHTANAGSKVKFSFLNAVGDPASITDVYFDDDNPPFIKWPPIGAAEIDTSAGVSFSEGANPGHLPGGDAVFAKPPDFSADSDPGNPGTAANGVDQGDEWLDITFELTDNYPDIPPDGLTTYDQLIDALTDGSFKVGIHLQAIGTNGNSLSFVTGGGGPSSAPTPIPEPATMLLLGTGLAGIAGTARRRKKQQK